MINMIKMIKMIKKLDEAHQAIGSRQSLVEWSDLTERPVSLRKASFFLLPLENSKDERSQQVIYRRVGEVLAQKRYHRDHRDHRDHRIRKVMEDLRGSRRTKEA